MPRTEITENGIEVTYDDYGKPIHIVGGIMDNGYEQWLEYDSNGNVIHWMANDGSEMWWE